MKTIIAHTIGGLGNQFFQYAVAIAAARRNNARAALDLSAFSWYRRPYALNAFNISLPPATNFDHALLAFWSGRCSPLKRIDRARPPQERMVRQDPGGYRYQPELLDMGPRHRIYLTGHWQNERYFDDVREQLLAEFTLRPEHSPSETSTAHDITTSQSVAVHIRRGDNIAKQDPKHPTRMVPQLGMVSADYVAAAMRRIHEAHPNARFFLFSDEPEWVRNNLSFPLPIEPIPSDTFTDVQEFELMRMCKHQIIANSTFSWWAAWLNDNPDKIVCAPKRWDERFPDYDTSGLIPASWNLV